MARLDWWPVGSTAASPPSWGPSHSRSSSVGWGTAGGSVPDRTTRSQQSHSRGTAHLSRALSKPTPQPQTRQGRCLPHLGEPRGGSSGACGVGEPPGHRPPSLRSRPQPGDPRPVRLLAGPHRATVRGRTRTCLAHLASRAGGQPPPKSRGTCHCALGRRCEELGASASAAHRALRPQEQPQVPGPRLLGSESAPPPPPAAGGLLTARSAGPGHHALSTRRTLPQGAEDTRAQAVPPLRRAPRGQVQVWCRPGRSSVIWEKRPQQP